MPLKNKILKKIGRQLNLLVLTLLFLISAPVILILFSPIYLIRAIIVLLCKYTRPDLDKMIDTRSSVLAIDDPYKNPKWNLVVWGILEGQINFPVFQDHIHKNIILKKKPNGQLSDPEFQQFYEKYMCFLWYKWDEDFDINHHMALWKKNDGQMRENELLELIKELTWRPFVKGKSPWEFIYIPEYISEDGIVKKCVFIFRVHHGLMDGYTLLRIILRDMGGYSLEAIAHPKYNQRNCISKIYTGIICWLKGPYELMEMLLETSDQNSLELSEETKNLNKNQITQMNMALSAKIPLDYLKDIKNRNRVSFSSVLIAGLSGGLRTLMLEKGMKIPEFINCAVAVPMPGHPERLTNYFIFSFIKLPIGSPDRRKRLSKVEKNVKHLKKSAAPRMNFLMVPLVGALPTFLMRPFTINKFSSTLLSNFPGPIGKDYFMNAVGGNNNQVLDLNFTAGIGEGNVGVGFFILSFGDGIKICSTGDASLFSTNDDVQYLNSKIIEEFGQLSSLESI